jgi:uncharacterized membrane protein YdjX (TVP38/TMEM64 family)
VIGLALLGGFVLVASLLISPEQVVRTIERWVNDPVRFAGALAAVYLFRPLVAGPLSLVSVLCGYVYGIALGVPVALAGAVMSCLGPYLLARCARTDIGLLGWVGRSGEHFFEATGDTRGVFAARLAPAPADVISYGAGVSGVPVGAFVLGTLLGEIPWTVGFVVAGASMGAFSVREASLDSLVPVVGAGVLAVFVLAGPVYRFLTGTENDCSPTE